MQTNRVPTIPSTTREAFVHHVVLVGSKPCPPPIHRGHHPVWFGPMYQVDICNMVDDVVIRDNGSGSIYRFPINPELMPWLIRLIEHMDVVDLYSPHPLDHAHNSTIRRNIMEIASRILQGETFPLEIFEPGAVVASTGGSDNHAEEMIDERIRAHPEAFVR